MHQDVKPQNIFVFSDDNTMDKTGSTEIKNVNLDDTYLKLSVLGPATIMEEGLYDPKSLSTIAAFMAPEMHTKLVEFDQNTTLTSAIDVWGLGLSFFNLCTLQEPEGSRFIKAAEGKIFVENLGMPVTFHQAEEYA